MFREVIDIYQHDVRHYMKTTAISALIGLLFLIIARQVDLNSAKGSSVTEDVLSIVSPDPLGFLIGIYAMSLGILAIAGQRIDAKENAPRLILIIRRFFRKVAVFSKETTFVFFGFLISCGIMIAFLHYDVKSILIPSIVVTLVIFLVYGFIDYTYRVFDMLRGENWAMVYLQEVLLGLILIGLSLPVFAVVYDRVI